MKIINIIIISIFTISTNIYATPEVLNKDDLVKQGRAEYGNSGINIYTDNEGNTWAIRERWDSSDLTGLVNAYVAGALMQHLLGNTITAEVTLVKGAKGAASKWLTGFKPLNDYFDKQWDPYANAFVPYYPQELDEQPVNGWERLILVMDFLGNGDRNGGNVGVVDGDESGKIAANVDYDESFVFYGTPFQSTKEQVYAGYFDVDEVLNNLDKLSNITPDEISQIVDERTNDIIGQVDFITERKNTYAHRSDLRWSPENIQNYTKAIKTGLIQRLHDLKLVKDELVLYKLINDGESIDAITSYIDTKLGGKLPIKGWGPDYLELIRNEHNQATVDQLRRHLQQRDEL